MKVKFTVSDVLTNLTVKHAKLVMTTVKTLVTISVTARKQSYALLLQMEFSACWTGGWKNEKYWYLYIRDFLQPQFLSYKLLQEDRV